MFKTQKNVPSHAILENMFRLLTLVFAWALFVQVRANQPQTHENSTTPHNTSTSSTPHQEVATDNHSTQMPHTEANNEVHTAHAEHSDAFEPGSFAMHHVADANELHLWGETTVSLPVMVYNRTSGQFVTGMSCCFQGEGRDGLRMEHGKIVESTTGTRDNLIDLSITKNVITLLVAALLMIVIFYTIRNRYLTHRNKAPRGIQSFFEPIIEFVRNDIAKQNITKGHEKYLPYLLTVFFFIWFLNMLGQIPIFGGNVTGNINFTAVLALFTAFIYNLSGNKGYWSHMLWMPGVPVFVKPLIAVIELAGTFIIRPVALAIRLFANITAGHFIIISLISLIFVFGKSTTIHTPANLGGGLMGAAIALPFTLFIMVIELLVAFIQAFIFTMLSAVFIGMATEESDSHGHH